MNEHMAANLLSSRISKPANIIHGGVSFLLFPLVFPGALYVVAGYVDEALCLLILQGGEINFKSETGDVKGGEKTFSIAQYSIIGT